MGGGKSADLRAIRSDQLRVNRWNPAMPGHRPGREAGHVNVIPDLAIVIGGWARAVGSSRLNGTPSVPSCRWRLATPMCTVRSWPDAREGGWASC